MPYWRDNWFFNIQALETPAAKKFQKLLLLQPGTRQVINIIAPTRNLRH